ncbi:MAG: LacI family transcriptional regulator [Treponema sp.]|nr:LacI family transcriptional regulator [Treponema sp.]
MKQKEIAKILNTSISTVSRVLGRSDTRSISDELKQQIISLAIQNGIKIKTKKYGILVGSYHEQMEEPFFADIIQYAANRFHELSYYKCFHSTAPEIDKMNEDEMINNYGHLDGVIIIASTPKKIFDRIARITDNIVQIGEVFAFNESTKFYPDFSDFPYDNITFDSYGMYIQYVKYLAGLGRKKIIFIYSVKKDDEDVYRYARVAGYVKGLQECGLAGKEQIFFANNTRFDGGYYIANEIYGKVDFDAVICHNDQIALGFMERLKTLGAKIPDDVMVMGYYDIAQAAAAQPPLTTARIDFKTIGYLSAEIINARVEKIISSPVSVKLGLEFIRRGSTGEAG